MESEFTRTSSKNVSLGYVKLFRSVTTWEWYKNPNIMRVFLHCLLCVSSKNYINRNFAVTKGSFFTSRRKLSNELGMSAYLIGKALSALQNSGEINYLKFRKGLKITVLNWEFYQCRALTKHKKEETDGWLL